jgi:hypothetical protein
MTTRVVHGVVGAIGAGKTTWARKVCALREWTYIPEYIDMRTSSGEYDGQTSLRAFIEKDITPYEFQRRILMIIDDYLSEHEPTGVCLIESPPTYALEVYGRQAVNDGLIDDDEMECLTAMAIDVSVKYGLPVLGRCAIRRAARGVAPPAGCDEQTVFHLDVDFLTTLEGIHARAREGEDGYPLTYLLNIFTLVMRVVETCNTVKQTS